MALAHPRRTGGQTSSAPVRQSPSLGGRFARWISATTFGKGALKGTLLSLPSSIWFLLFLLLPMVIVLVFGFATISPTTLSISYSELTWDHYPFALNPASPALPLTASTLIVSAITALGSLAAG